jgi:Xaa-Pro aminopeptidase
MHRAAASSLRRQIPSPSPSLRLIVSLSQASVSSAFRARIGGGASFSPSSAYLDDLFRHQRGHNRTFNTSTRLQSASAMGADAASIVDTRERVEKLRGLMKEHKVDIYIVPSEDQHASEYPCDSDLRRGYISGFSGSAGCAVITNTQAALFTDGRYFLQAGQQLEPNTWTLMKQGETNVPTWQEYLSKNVAAKSKIGVDPSLISPDDARTISTELTKVGSSLVPLEKNLVDLIWQDRPKRPSEKIFVLDDKYTGRSVASKIQEVQSELKKKGKHLKGFVANMLDEVAWLFNLRGSDVPYNPVFFAYAIVLLDKSILYVDESQFDSSVTSHLGKEVEIKSYELFYSDLHEIGAGLSKGEKILIGKRATLAVQEALGGDAKVQVDRSIIVDQKSIKNETEIQGFRSSHIRDGAALANYFAWLEEQLASGVEVTEYRGAEELEKYRRKLDHFRGLSFTTISSTGANGAIIHYSADPKTSLVIDPKEIYLCDSGGQFTDGTTDVTRTWHFGQPQPEQIRAYTRVLQGHIAIDTAVFPQGTTGYLLDPLARRPLWGEGWDFRHGTGHGVGHFLNVHEGPHGIGTRAIFNETSLKDGMVVSNEPGFYKDGAWGIRLENLVVVRKAKTANNFGDKGFLCFEHLTMCPFQMSLIDASLLTESEKTWLRDYHADTLRKVGPILEKAGDERGLSWLKRHCSVDL